MFAEVSHQYGKNPNLTNNGIFEYIYDCENRLTEAKQNGQTVASYKYNYLVRQVRKTVSASITAY